MKRKKATAVWDKAPLYENDGGAGDGEDNMPSKFKALLERKKVILDRPSRPLKKQKQKGDAAGALLQSDEGITKKFNNAAAERESTKDKASIFSKIRSMKREPGESFTAFHGRLCALTNPMVHERMNQVKPLREKRKEFLEERKRQKRRKTTKNFDDVHEEDKPLPVPSERDDDDDTTKQKVHDTWNVTRTRGPKKALVDVVRFGEVVQAPPKLTAIPKMRIKDKHNSNVGGGGGVKQHFEKEALRLQVIAAYRALKNNKNT